MIKPTLNYTKLVCNEKATTTDPSLVKRVL